MAWMQVVVGDLLHPSPEFLHGGIIVAALLSIISAGSEWRDARRANDPHRRSVRRLRAVLAFVAAGILVYAAVQF